MVADARFLIDSSVCIALLKGDSPVAMRRVQQCDVGELATSTIVFAEVMLGAVLRAAAEQAQALFRMIPPQPFDVEAARTYAGLEFRRGNFDRLIAAHAIALDLTLVTNNERDFADVPGLRIENWTLAQP